MIDYNAGHTYELLFNSIPIIMIGFVVGAIQFLNIDGGEEVKGFKKFKLFLKISATAGVLALFTFFITDNFDLTYQTRVGLSIFIAFAGYEKIQSIIDKIIDTVQHKVNKT